MKILLVDDDPDIRLVGEVALSGDGRHTVRTASGGLEGLEAIRSDPPDVVVTDLFMEDMDGVALVRALRDDPETVDIPVVFLTARAGSDEVERLRAEGARGVLPKPFDPTLLLERLEQILRTGP